MSEKHELTDQEFIENIVKAIVDHPEDVVTGRMLDERGVLIQLTVNREDMGKVIGREGRTAKSLRSLLRVFGARLETRINLKIVNSEDEGALVTKPEIVPEVSDKKAARTAKSEPVKTPAAQAPAVEEKATGVF